MSTQQERARERREEEARAHQFLDVGPFRLGGRAVIEVLRRMFRGSPGAAGRDGTTSTDLDRAVDPDPPAERIDRVTALLDEIGLEVTEERIRHYGDMDEATFETVAEHLRGAYRRARHPLHADAERRAREVNR